MNRTIRSLTVVGPLAATVLTLGAGAAHADDPYDPGWYHLGGPGVPEGGIHFRGEDSEDDGPTIELVPRTVPFPEGAVIQPRPDVDIEPIPFPDLGLEPTLPEGAVLPGEDVGPRRVTPEGPVHVIPRPGGGHPEICCPPEGGSAVEPGDETTDTVPDTSSDDTSKHTRTVDHETPQEQQEVPEPTRIDASATVAPQSTEATPATDQGATLAWAVLGGGLLTAVGGATVLRRKDRA